MNSFHWITVGRISQAAETAIKANGGTVYLLSRTPSLIIVGLPCRYIPGGFTDILMSGQREIVIKVPSYGLHLIWRGQVKLPRDHMSHVSADQTELRLADEKQD